MAKRITAKIEIYTDKEGNQKGKYVDIGVILSNDNGEYILLNPTIDLSGVLIKQRLMNPQKAGGSVMCNIFTDEPRQQASNSAPDADFDDDIPF